MVIDEKFLIKFPVMATEKKQDFLQVYRRKRILMLNARVILKAELDKRKTHDVESHQFF